MAVKNFWLGQTTNRSESSEEIIDLFVGWAKYQIGILNTKTRNIICCVNENFDNFFIHFQQGGQENRRRKKVFFFKMYKKVECY